MELVKIILYGIVWGLEGWKAGISHGQTTRGAAAICVGWMSGYKLRVERQVVVEFANRINNSRAPKCSENNYNYFGKQWEPTEPRESCSSYKCGKIDSSQK